jgi:hypothetical protein
MGIRFRLLGFLLPFFFMVCSYGAYFPHEWAKDDIWLFSGVDGDTGAYFIDPMDSKTLRERVVFPEILVSRDVANWIDPGNIAKAGWCVVYHEDEDPAVLQALASLREHRKGLAGDRYREIVITREEMTEKRWLKERFFEKHKVAPGRADPMKLPYYILIVGSPALIPFSFQYELDLNYAVGRLSFDEPAAYANYAQNVIDAEQRSFSRQRRVVVFGPDNRNDELTKKSKEDLAEPLVSSLRKLNEDSPWVVHRILGRSATKAKLEACMGGNNAPALLLTAGHAITIEKDHERRKQLQGSIICSDWGGGGREKVFPHQYFSARDIKPGRDYRGMVAFFYACFSAGTPEYSSFSKPDEARERLNDYPFVAALPKALLGHERGALAVIGHVDLTNVNAFRWQKEVHSINHFIEVFYALMQGQTAGHAMETFGQRLADIQGSINKFLGAKDQDDYRYLQLWSGYHDARGFVLLGDPAVKIPVSD